MHQRRTGRRHALPSTSTASDGYTSEPDGNAIYDWGYGVAGQGLPTARAGALRQSR